MDGSGKEQIGFMTMISMSLLTLSSLAVEWTDSTHLCTYTVEVDQHQNYCIV